METTGVKKSLSLIILAIVAYNVLAIIGSAFSLVEGFNDVASFAGGESSTAINVIGWIITIATIGGYVLYVVGLTQFSGYLDQVGSSAVKLVRLGVIIALVSTLPIPILSGILALVAFIVELVGYNQLKSSGSLSPVGVSGANLLFITMIIGVVGAILGWIPLIGGIIKIIFGVICFILVLVGWMKIRQSFNTPTA